MLDLARWVRFRWHLRPKIAVGDSKFGTIRNIVALEQDGLRAYLAMPDLNKRSGLYTLDQFRYDAERDVYTCPQGQFLPLSSFDQYQQAFMYRTKRKICNACPVKTKCTTSAYGRVLRRLVVQDYIDRVRAYHGTADYQRAMRKRALWNEPLFGEAKQWHHLLQFRLRRLKKVNIQALLIAAGQNIKRLLRIKHHYFPPPPLKPAASVPQVALGYRFTRPQLSLSSK